MKCAHPAISYIKGRPCTDSHGEPNWPSDHCPSRVIVKNLPYGHRYPEVHDQAPISQGIRNHANHCARTSADSRGDGASTTQPIFRRGGPERTSQAQTPGAKMRGPSSRGETTKKTRTLPRSNAGRTCVEPDQLMVLKATRFPVANWVVSRVADGQLIS